MGYKKQSGRLGESTAASYKPVTIPASIGGINGISSLSAMPASDAIYMFNLVPVEFGIRLRKGYREWATGCGTEDVRTILNYESNLDQTGDKLWAVTKEGIWDVTTFGETSPTQDVVFSDNTDPAGYGVKCEFTNDESGHYMFYADGKNGLHQYTDATGLWTIPAGGTAPGEWSYDIPGGAIDQPFPVDDIVFVMQHKQRIWVILENDDDAWYLPVTAIAGKLKRFIFGSKFPRGGRLMGLWTWTVDGGAGLNDYLMGIGKAGDVVMYSGGDPELVETTAADPWVGVGSWYVGDMPASRRVVSQHGAEMYILSSFGLTSVRDLLGGIVASDIATSAASKIARYLREDVNSALERYDWELSLHPADGFLQIILPEPSNTPYTQYVQNLTTQAWGMWENVPMLCAETWNAEYIMGSKAGVVLLYEGGYDGRTLAGDAGNPVEFRTLSSFQGYDAHGLNKRAGFARAIAVTSGAVTWNVQAVYDYQIDALVTQPGAVPANAGSLWDSAIWNTDVWGYGALSTTQLSIGTMGMGRTIAIACRGSATDRFTLAAWDLSFTQGGFL